MKNENILKTKSYQFAIRVVKLVKFLQENKKEFILSKQLIRRGTAIGALVAESEFAQSKLDFISKGIVVNIEDDIITINLNVILEYGMQIEVVAQNIVDNVKYNIKNLTGLDVGHVNVIVQGVRID